MKLTEQQRAEMDRQRREHPGRRRFVLTFTPEQREQYRQAVAEELAARSENIRRALPTHDHQVYLRDEWTRFVRSRMTPQHA